jgi:hypothetical protein
MNLQDIITATQKQEDLKLLLIGDKIAPKNVNFVVGLIANKPTSNVLYWVDRMINEVNATVVSLIKVDITKVVALFSNARTHLKFPKITLLLDETDFHSLVRFSIDRKGRNVIWMNSAHSYGTTYGSINMDSGDVNLKSAGESIKTELLELLRRFCENPIQLVMLHGKLTGNCCFCRLPLTDERSLQSGYGDTCARHYHLPWGKQNNMTAIGDWALNGVKS